MKATKWARATILACVVFSGLGCSSLGQKMLQWTGSEIAVGKDAVHPADFPLPPPPSGTLQTSAKIGLGGVDTTTVVYEVQGSDIEGLLTPYEEVMKQAGRTIERETRDGNHVVSSEGSDGTHWSAVVSPSAPGKLSLTLVVVTLPKSEP